ncbi:MAG: zeta toxin family protein [Deltaproteobacteria bacterium]|nr:zeta toxin family protein [Deltaproteobacteria bacterium]
MAGPNGAGKSTTAPMLLRDAFEVEEFVNADAIAQGLSAFAPENVAMDAGLIMLKRLHELAKKLINFAFETTLAARSFAPWLATLMAAGYQSHLMFLALPNVEMAIDRVSLRVTLGGHNIPEYTIKRRFAAGLANFFRLYRSVVSSWMFYDNSSPAHPLLIAQGVGQTSERLHDSLMYEVFLKEYDNER